MSHQPERKEKNCLNCGATVAGRYCQKCGQENIETRESFWSLTKHFVFDILHFDGNFFHTTGQLFTRPGFVARQYAEGKRATYLHPIRMYLFMSAFFFLIFFSLEGSPTATNTYDTDHLNGVQRLKLADKLRKRLEASPEDTSLQGRIARLSDTLRPALNEDINHSGGSFFSMNGKHYRSRTQYDSIQKALPSKDRDNWLVRQLNRRGLALDEKYKGREDEAGQLVIEKFYHRMPYLFFFSLPFFALILKLLYMRRKNFYYSDHAVFTLYHYIFSFLLLLIALALGELKYLTGWKWMDFANLLLFFYGLVYLFIEMKKFYRQGFWKTLFKFLLLNILAGLVLFVLFAFFIFFSIFQL